MPRDVQNYEDLANPKLKGKICTRSGSHVYNLSLMSALIEHWGESKAEDWARGVVANFARTPKGGDTDQIMAVAAGECAVGISNSYYFVRLMKSEKPEEKKALQSVALVWPNQKSFGTHMNISGAGVLKSAPHREAAVQYLEYLASHEAQSYFANGNNEWPVVKGIKPDNPRACLARHVQDGHAQHRGPRQEPAARAENLRSRRLQVTQLSQRVGRQVGHAPSA